MQIYFKDVIALPMILAPPAKELTTSAHRHFMGSTQTDYCRLMQQHGEPYRIHKRGSPNDRSRLSEVRLGGPPRTLIVRRGSDSRDGDQYCTDWPLACVLASSLPGALRCGVEQPVRILAQFDVRDRNTRDAR
jgi:hypothetical protein